MAGTVQGALDYAKSLIIGEDFRITNPDGSRNTGKGSGEDLVAMYLGEQVVRNITYGCIEVTTPFLFVCPLTHEGVEVNDSSYARALVNPKMHSLRNALLAGANMILVNNPDYDPLDTSPTAAPEHIHILNPDQIALKGIYSISKSSIRFAPAETEPGKAALGISFTIVHEEVT